MGHARSTWCGVPVSEVSWQPSLLAVRQADVVPQNREDQNETDGENMRKAVKDLVTS